ncbi:hypothetical protein DFH08DRAFT_802392 [Mycena albidolilacea]|uniref:Uncharacterized protein n=1 Tax=Mycena albidolilacea TaxID=1033008 RepID=A0AAD7AH75_9AGAR|nr:hypothetical protein DFH08DRAFT_802392 [Mycena albidolilacea]
MLHTGLWPGKDLMVPDPNVPDWKESMTRIKHHNKAVPHDEYKFRWFECTDGIIYDSESSILQPSMLRWLTQSRKFCEIAEVDLTAEQVGKVRMPFYMLPDHPDHQNPLLKEIFGAAIQQVAKILMDFDLSHPVVANFAEYFKSVRAAERRWRVANGMLFFHDIDGKTVNLNERSTWFKAVRERREAFRYIGLNAVQMLGNIYSGLCVAWPELYKLVCPSVGKVK